MQAGNQAALRWAPRLAFLALGPLLAVCAMVAAGALKQGLATWQFPFLPAAGRSRTVPPPLMPPAPVDPQALLAPPWPPVLTPEEVARAEGYYGTGRRLRALAAKLLAGQAIKAYTLGGSVTMGNGASDMSHTAYAPRFFQLLNASFPHSAHVMRNRGIGASASSLFAACLQRMVPDDADLVVVEFTANEPPRAPYASDPRRGYEQLLRRVLTLGAGGNGTGGDAPAVIVLHHYSWPLSAGDGVAEGLFYASAEAELGMFSHYYDLPQVSIRSGVWPLMAAGIEGFQVDRVVQQQVNVRRPPDFELQPVPAAAAGTEGRYYFADLQHPYDTGHLAMAEALAGPLRRALAEELAARAGRDDGGSGAGGSGRAATSSGGGGGSPHAISQQERRQQRRDARLSGLPPPMVPGNYEPPSMACFLQEDFKPVAVRHSPGFKYLAERPQKRTFVAQKWGWTGQQPGEWVELEVDTSGHPGSAAPTPNGAQLATVSLAHLRSHSHMGTARVECVSGCECRPVKLDSTWKMPVTLMDRFTMQATQHRRCRLRVTILDEPGMVPSDGHKIKLMALMVTSFPIRLGHPSGLEMVA